MYCSVYKIIYLFIFHQSIQKVHIKKKRKKKKQFNNKTLKKNKKNKVDTG
jgi:predicted membrane protein